LRFGGGVIGARKAETCRLPVTFENTMHNQEAFYDSYIRPFRLVEQLGLECGYEKSFKLIDQHLLRNRYMLGIEKSILDNQKLSAICEQMEMPEKFIDEFFDNVADANLVLLGFEEGVDDCTYKIYLEYWDRLRARMSAGQAPHEPETLFQGFKWSALDNSRAVLTDYACFPLLEVDEIIDRLGGLLSTGEDRRVFDAISEIITTAARLARDRQLVYLEAREEDNPRVSFDINLYPADITLQSICAPLERLFRYYSIPNDELDRLYGQVGSRPLGHLSAGTDRSGKDFVTVYYETQP
jgi:hypothetical protein